MGSHLAEEGEGERDGVTKEREGYIRCETGILLFVQGQPKVERQKNVGWGVGNSHHLCIVSCNPLKYVRKGFYAQAIM